MIQIFKDRLWTDKDTGKTKRGFIPTKIKATSVTDLLQNIEVYIDKIPIEERYNLHYTLCDIADGSRKAFIQQDVIAFDIDGIDVERFKEYLPPILYVLKAEESETGIVVSGNGLHFIIGTDVVITDGNYFQQSRPIYKAVCNLINLELKKMGLPGDAESGPWSSGHTLRLPMTQNRKTPECGYKNQNKVTECTIHTRLIATKPGYCIENLVDMQEIKDEDALSNYDEYTSNIPLDIPGVQEGCDFLKHCRKEPGKINEENWYKMLSIVARLGANGRDLAHSYSEGHPGYTYEECEAKIEKALVQSGPRTCRNIGESFDCSKCSNNGNVHSPITITSETFIKTKNNGFYELKKIVRKDGTVSLGKGKPCYDDLLKYFDKKYFHFSTETGMIYTWKDTHWEVMEKTFVESFAENNFEPTPSSAMVNEFVNKVRRTNVKRTTWMQDSIFQRVNLSNGILDLTKKEPELIPHSRKYGFTTVLNYEYDPEAACPKFDYFLDSCMLGREALKKILMEFYAYITMNHPCTSAKALFLLGDGSNGKSKYVELLEEMLGEGAYSAIPLNELNNDQKRALLYNKLANISEETPTKSLLESSYFKALVAGSVTTAKVVYAQPFNFKNRAKFISVCNELPTTVDHTFGGYRRMIIVPWDATFDGDTDDKNILDKMLEEKAGILNRIIEANARLVDKGFTSAKEVDAVIEEYKSENDPVYNYFKNVLKVTTEDEHRVQAKSLYNSFTRYCSEEGIRQNEVLSNVKFGKRFKTLTKNKVTIAKIKGSIYYKGLQILTEESDY